MRSDLYQEMYELEENYWWHVAKRRLVRRLLEGCLKNVDGELSYLDVGCGTGKLMEEKRAWKPWKKMLGLDGSQEALRFCQRRGIKAVKKANFEKKLPLGDGSFDVLTSLDVVEHVEKDYELMKEFYRVLKPGGITVITVPAYRWMWTYWDDVLEHKRRYSAYEIKTRFKKAGFEIEKISYFYSYLLPVAIFFRILKSLSPKSKASSDFFRLPKLVNSFLLRLSAMETEVIERVNLPMGLSIVCVARKN